jgi:hypothetical protein
LICKILILKQSKQMETLAEKEYATASVANVNTTNSAMDLLVSAIKPESRKTESRYSKFNEEKLRREIRERRALEPVEPKKEEQDFIEPPTSTNESFKSLPALETEFISSDSEQTKAVSPPVISNLESLGVKFKSQANNDKKLETKTEAPSKPKSIKKDRLAEAISALEERIQQLDAAKKNATKQATKTVHIPPVLKSHIQPAQPLTEIVKPFANIATKYVPVFQKTVSEDEFVLAESILAPSDKIIVPAVEESEKSELLIMKPAEIEVEKEQISEEKYLLLPLTLKKVEEFAEIPSITEGVEESIEISQVVVDSTEVLPVVQKSTEILPVVQESAEILPLSVTKESIEILPVVEEPIKLIVKSVKFQIQEDQVSEDKNLESSTKSNKYELSAEIISKGDTAKVELGNIKPTVESVKPKSVVEPALKNSKVFELEQTVELLRSAQVGNLILEEQIRQSNVTLEAQSRLIEDLENTKNILVTKMEKQNNKQAAHISELEKVVENLQFEYSRSEKVENDLKALVEKRDAQLSELTASNKDIQFRYTNATKKAQEKLEEQINYIEDLEQKLKIETARAEEFESALIGSHRSNSQKKVSLELQLAELEKALIVSKKNESITLEKIKGLESKLNNLENFELYNLQRKYSESQKALKIANSECDKLKLNLENANILALERADKIQDLEQSLLAQEDLITANSENLVKSSKSLPQISTFVSLLILTSVLLGIFYYNPDLLHPQVRQIMDLLSERIREVNIYYIQIFLI